MPDQTDIDQVRNHCAEQADQGGSKYPGMSYEQGVEAAILWLQGRGSNPVQD